MNTYTYSAATGMALRSSDGAAVPWDRERDRPLDMDGLSGRTWVADGSPESLTFPVPVPQPYLTGGDVIDGLSPAQAKAPDVDPRDLVRIQAAPMASMVKSKIARLAKANGITADALLAQATPSGGL